MSGQPNLGQLGRFGWQTELFLTHSAMSSNIKYEPFMSDPVQCTYTHVLVVPVVPGTITRVECI